MPRETFVLHPKTGQLVPKAEYIRPVSCGGPMVIGDIKGYKSMVTGEMITTRRRHREHLKETNCIEIGNEIPKQQAKPMAPIEPDIKRAIEELRSR